jgi:hypothetical protein
MMMVRFMTGSESIHSADAWIFARRMPNGLKTYPHELQCDFVWKTAQPR